jgi:hypothetical protein
MKQTLKEALVEKYGKGTPERPVEIPFPWIITVLSDVGEALLFAFQHNVLHLVRGHALVVLRASCCRCHSRTFALRKFLS